MDLLQPHFQTFQRNKLASHLYQFQEYCHKQSEWRGIKKKFGYHEHEFTKTTHGINKTPVSTELSDISYFCSKRADSCVLNIP